MVSKALSEVIRPMTATKASLELSKCPEPTYSMGTIGKGRHRG